ncbi:MAG: DUF2141 domain-containing protein [Prolixibacteraceae bacterium]|nr:DUF2141 domain-containing protein [Prolixibacteraceae bacterium]
MAITLLCSIYVYSQNSLEVEIYNLRNSTGQIVLELMDEEKNSLISETALIDENSCVMKFNNLKPGNYAVRFFHDENSNKILDTNWIKIPKEGFGFSNDPFGPFGPKEFKHWIFEIKGETKIKLLTKYFL